MLSKQDMDIQSYHKVYNCRKLEWEVSSRISKRATQYRASLAKVGSEGVHSFIEEDH